MSEYQLLMPKMGESVIEATILTWHKQPGDTINEHDVIVEVATDKVDSEVPSPVSGVLKKILHDVNAVVGVGQPLAIIEVEGEVSAPAPAPAKAAAPAPEVKAPAPVAAPQPEVPATPPAPAAPTPPAIPAVPVAPAPAPVLSGNRYYSPLVLNIAQAENVTMQELEAIAGSGLEGRVTKEDILQYVADRNSGQLAPPPAPAPIASASTVAKPAAETVRETTVSPDGNFEIIEMDRMRKIISKHMIESKNTSAHVSSFVECDVTNIVRWRDKNKAAFQKREGFSLSFMPVFVEAISKSIKDFPMINVSVDGDKIIRKKDINIGIATALPNGNLIVPVVKNADQKSLLGIAKAMNNIVVKARNNNLQADDVSEGTYTISNIGTFGNIIGTPIINQPQVAIMAVGSITKKPVVIEVDGQDVIAVRHMMYLSHTYDHRVVDGMLGGMFVKKVADYLEKFDLHQEI